ncbi:MAG: hypothetical protein AAFX94_02825, partial [Myxococcota bacterium]
MIPLLALALIAQAEARLDRVIAVVDREVITESELVLEARLALARRGATRSASQPIDERFLASFLDYLINQLLVSTQARRVASTEVSDDEVAAEIERFADKFPTRTAFDSFLQDFDVSDDRLRASILRDLRNGVYVTRRMNVRLMGRDLPPDSTEYIDALELWLR